MKNSKRAKHFTKYFWTFIISILSLLEGFILGSIRIYPLTKDSLFKNLYLFILALFLWGMLSFLTILVEIGLRKNRIIFILISSLLFSLSFSLSSKIFLLFPLTVMIIAPLFFFLYKKAKERANLFVKFKLKEIILPTVKLSFTYLLFAIAFLTFFQTNFILKQKQQFTPEDLRAVLRPFYPYINRYVNIAMQRTIYMEVQKTLGITEKKELARIIITESIETLSEGTIRRRMGINKASIPLEKITITETGEVDVSQAIEIIIPKLTEEINKLSAQYKNLIPFTISLLSLIVIYPFIGIFTLFLHPLLLSLFLILKYFNLIKIEKKPTEQEVARIAY